MAVGTRSQAVREISSKARNLGTPSHLHPWVFATLEKRATFLSAYQPIRAAGPSKVATTFERRVIGHSLFDRRRNFRDALKPATVALRSGKMYGFPTVRTIAPGRPSASTSGRRRHHHCHDRRVPCQPRAREGIPLHTVLTRSKHFRLARTYIPIHNTLLIR